MGNLDAGEAFDDFEGSVTFSVPRVTADQDGNPRAYASDGFAVDELHACWDLQWRASSGDIAGIDYRGCSTWLGCDACATGTIVPATR